MDPEYCELTPERIRDYIEAHFAEPITPRDVAAALNYSLCHVTHVARRALGASISDLILQRRILAAQELLAGGTAVTQVARRVGFRDMAYFSRRFTRATGVSPSRWKRMQENARVPTRCHACGTVLPLVALA